MFLIEILFQRRFFLHTCRDDSKIFYCASSRTLGAHIKPETMWKRVIFSTVTSVCLVQFSFPRHGSRKTSIAMLQVPTTTAHELENESRALPQNRHTALLARQSDRIDRGFWRLVYPSTWSCWTTCKNFLSAQSAKACLGGTWTQSTSTREGEEKPLCPNLLSLSLA
jgi:hypothetical protein